MSDQPVAEETVPIPPKGSGGGNKVLLIILGVVLACIVLVGVVLTAGAFYVKNRLVKDIAKTQGVDIKNFDAKNGTAEYSIKTDEGEMTTTVSKELPDDFPLQELPVYDGVITTTNRINVGGTSSWSVIMDTDDDTKTVGNTIKQELKDNGWDILMEQESDDRNMKTAKKGDYSAVISYQQETDDADKKVTRISYSITRKDKDKE